MSRTSTLLFHLVTDRWTLTLKTNSSPDKDLGQLQDVLAARGPWPRELPKMRIGSDAPVFDLPGQGDESGEQAFFHGHRECPCVFENRQYTLWIETVGCDLVDVAHPVLNDVGMALERNASRCFGTLRTGNDIGRFMLLVSTTKDGVSRQDRVWWDVWPLKLDYGCDLKSLTDAVERKYPLWLFRFLAPTDHEAGRSDRLQDRFLLLWLKQFEGLRDRFEKGVRTVIRSPHQRLDEHVRHLRADRIKGKMSPRLQERIAQYRERPELRHRVESRRSSFDTAENRFVKHAVGQVASRLDQVEKAIRTLGKEDGTERKDAVSKGFLESLGTWRRTARSQGSATLFRGVGDFEGLTQESLVLHNRAGYSAVYRSWLELRHYLEFFAKVRSANIGMRQISELYELWCFLEVRRILVGDGSGDTGLGFTESAPPRRPKITKESLDAKLADGFGAAFHLRHQGAGISVRLAHEPAFSAGGDDSLHSFTVRQRPDIVLEAKWGEGEDARRLLWVFDAKYRIKLDGDLDSADIKSDGPLVPSDAINQMHRYRDSLILRHQGEKSRPVIGAYALYPGVFNQTSSVNPYVAAIHEVGIGAFALLPGGDAQGRSGNDRNCHWLRSICALRSGWMSRRATGSTTPPRCWRRRTCASR